MAEVELSHVTKAFGPQAAAVDDVSFTAAAGEFVALLGPSGCGKSTTLRMIAGLDTPSTGRILIDGRDVTQLPPAQRRISMVFQSYALFPHLDVRENILFGLKVRREPARDPARRVRMTARLGRGRGALTEYRVLRRFDRFTLLEVRIGTGRTHQIRVHLAAMGHPVAGDRLYGAPAQVEGRPPLGRVFLHSRRIRFADPAGGEPVTVEAPLPPELEAWLEGLI